MNKISQRDVKKTAAIFEQASEDKQHCMVCGGPSEKIGTHAQSVQYQCSKCGYKFSNR